MEETRFVDERDDVVKATVPLVQTLGLSRRIRKDGVLLVGVNHLESRFLHLLVRVDTVI
jgi:hypothetical protein